MRNSGWPWRLARSAGLISVCCSTLGILDAADHRSELLEGPGPVAAGMLDASAPLSERSMILRDKKQRIVAESARAARLAHEQAVTASLDDRLDLAGARG